MAVPFMMQWLLGTWFVVASDAPIWLKGDKQSPTLNYTLVEEKGKYLLLDETKYYRQGKQKTITGYDHAVKDKDSAFLWKGKGMLFFVTSKWRVCLQDKEGRWAVIAYSKTLFTPEGIDILSRKPVLDPITITNIRKMLQQDKLLAKHEGRLKIISQK